MDRPTWEANRGHTGVAQYLTQSRDGWRQGRSEPERIFPVADASEGNEFRVVVFVHARFLPKAGQTLQDVTTGWRIDVPAWQGGTHEGICRPPAGADIRGA